VNSWPFKTAKTLVSLLVKQPVYGEAGEPPSCGIGLCFAECAPRIARKRVVHPKWFQHLGNEPNESGTILLAVKIPMLAVRDSKKVDAVGNDNAVCGDRCAKGLASREHL
jgi:hypothetical protein